MAVVQLDLFGWTRTEPEPDTVAVTKQGITVDDLSDSLIRHFGHWVGQHQNLLEDDWTVCETLVGIHKRFTHEQLREVYKTETWYRAWGRFNQFYLTNRVRGDAFGLKWGE